MTTMPGLQEPAVSPEAASDDWEDEAAEPAFKPLTREEALQWRVRQPVISVWGLVGVQLLVGVAAALLAWLLTRQAPVAWSVLYGAAAVVVPSALMAYGVTGSFLSRWLAGAANAALAGFLLWEGVKILLAMAMLWSAPKVVPDLSWLGLLAGLVLVLKVYWFGFWIRTKSSNVNG